MRIHPSPLLLTLGTLCLALLLSPAHAVPGYVDAPPLKQVVKTAIGEVKAGTLQLPMITWGGDMATIHANGDAARTAAGSAIHRQGMEVELVRRDVFRQQVEAYLKGESPFLRGTLGMLNMAREVLDADPRTKPVVLFQLTWSAGGDALVVKPGIHSAADLKGKTLALQAYGPHVDYLTKILADAGLTPKDVTIRWLPDLTGSDNSPPAALYEKDIDAAFVIIPDALALTSNGTVGTGAEDSIKGAKILLSTKTANRIIADVYAVRSDWYEANRDTAQKLVDAMLEGQTALKKLMDNPDANRSAWQQMISASAKLLLDSADATGDAEGLYADAEFVGLEGNRKFLTDDKYPRNLTNLNQQIQKSFTSLGLIASSAGMASADWPTGKVASGGAVAESPRFNEAEVASVVARRQQQGNLSEGELFSFEIFFQPNQNDFSVDLYRDSFVKVVDLASTYGGAIITVEGHSDPMGYLRKKKENSPEVVLGRIKQSAKNLSLSRAVAVRDAIINYGESQGIVLDPSQFAVVGHGISNPASGICGTDPCAPKTEREWRDNMRVVFRIVQIEAESAVFRPL